MSCSRLIFYFWIIGLLLLIGLWGRSLFHEYGFDYASGKNTTVYSCEMHSGSLSLDRYLEGFGHPQFDFYTRDYVSGDVTGDPFDDRRLNRPPNFWGKFEFAGPTHYQSFAITIPIWVLIVLLTALCATTHILQQRRRNSRKPI